MKGKGFPKVWGSSRGDQLVRIQLETPKKLSTNYKKLVEEISKLNGKLNPKFNRVELDWLT